MIILLASLISKKVSRMDLLKITYFVNQYPKVSHSFIRREILALERQGVEVQRIALRGWDGDLMDAEDIRERGCTHYVLQGGITGLLQAAFGMLMAKPTGFFRGLMLALKMSLRSDRSWPYHLIYLAEACCIVQWLKKFGANHIHAHFGTNSAEVVMLAHVLCEVPYSFTVHGPEEFDKPEFIGLAEKIRRSTFVVAISSFGRSQLYRWVDRPSWEKVKVVRCGLEQAFYEVPDLPITNHPRLVCVGRLCEQKGQFILVQAAAILASKGVDFELVLAGDGEMRAEIEELIGVFGLNKYIRITGWINSDQVREELLASRAMVLPSFAEGLPVVIMEAMALGRPVLTTYIAGIPELVKQKENGWLFSAGSIEELVLAMESCLITPVSDLEQMGKQARSRVLELHNVDREAAKLAALFRQAAEKNLITSEIKREIYS
jgi:colanic acid/amylovoran biosynthesis glycosyltransferase